MKVLLFTHERDIDGMGSIVIGRHAFADFCYVPCNTYEVNDKVSEWIENGKIYDFDVVFVTDLCIQEPLLSYIAGNSLLRDKVCILDHHKSEIDLGNDRYPFVHIVLEDERGLCSGTSLFYDYLLFHGMIEEHAALAQFVELVRQYDTWEWQKKYHEPRARKLHILFEQLGYPQYIERMMELTKKDNFVLAEREEKIVEEFEKQLEETMQKILEGMTLKELSLDQNYRIGFVHTSYQYRNDLAERVRHSNPHQIDVLGMIIEDKGSISYRAITDVDVSKIAVSFGGNGHAEAASHPKDNRQFQLFMK